jgi:hypothetical protein
MEQAALATVHFIPRRKKLGGAFDKPVPAG